MIKSLSMGSFIISLKNTTLHQPVCRTVSSETYVIEDACNYVSTKYYPAGDKIRKRIIRRKAQGLAIKNGKLGTILQEKDSIT